MASYSELLKDPRWQRLRLEMLSAANWRCVGCSSTEKTLHVHHVRYIKGRKPWEYATSELRVLCAECHEQLHAMQEKFAEVLSAIDPLLADTCVALLGGFLYAGLDTNDAARTLDQCAFRAGALARLVTGGSLDAEKRVAAILEADTEGRQLSPVEESIFAEYRGIQ